MKTKLLERFLCQEWAIMPSALSVRANRLMSMSKDAAEQIEKPSAQLPKRPEQDYYGNPIEKMSFPMPGVAVVPVKGTLVHGATPFEKWAYGDIDYADVSDDLKEVKSKADVIVLDVDSPGGTIMGSDELMNDIDELIKHKMVLSTTRSVQASAAYKVAMGANRMLASGSAIVGSIGVISAVMTMEDMLKQFGVDVNLFASGEYKAMGSPYKDMPEKHKKRMTETVENMGARFRMQVAERRPTIDASDMEGQVFTGEQALFNGYIDEIGSLSDVLALIKTS